MDELYGGSAMQLNQAANIPGRCILPTRRQQLILKKDQLEQMLEIVNKALAALDAHPDLEEFAEALSRAL
jgi:chaperonin cofactor prefoldin